MSMRAAKTDGVAPKPPPAKKAVSVKKSGQPKTKAYSRFVAEGLQL